MIGYRTLNVGEVEIRLDNTLWPIHSGRTEAQMKRMGDEGRAHFRF